MFSLLNRKRKSRALPLTVEKVDVARYCGTWYEIASIPAKRQRNCSKTKAEYTLSGTGPVQVRNSCMRRGRSVSITATASPVQGSGNAHLKVRFFRIILADYLVIELAEDYSWAVVSNRSGTSLWLLARTPYLDQEIFESILGKLQNRGIDSSKLVKTVQ
ncbi:MAG: lipocalin family protein [Chlorobiaceae bacterium]|nr:lipocalin family protein [Chlorobiaceae bacterium]